MSKLLATLEGMNLEPKSTNQELASNSTSKGVIDTARQAMVVLNIKIPASLRDEIDEFIKKHETPYSKVILKDLVAGAIEEFLAKRK